MRSIYRRLSSTAVAVLLFCILILVEAAPVHAFLFRSGKAKAAAGKPQVEEPQQRQVEEAPKRRWWKIGRSRSKEQVKPAEESAVEKPAKRRWWKFGRGRPRTEVSAKPQVEEPSRQDAGKVRKKWWRRPFGRSAEKKAGKAPMPSLDVRYHMRIPDKTLEREMLDLFDHRRKNMEQIALLRDLLQERNDSLTEINERQRRHFGMDPSELYEYDPTNHTLYAVGSLTNRRTSAVAGRDRQLHLQFVKDEQLRNFLTLNTSKHVVLEQMRMLGLLISEKQLEANRITAALEARFAIRDDRNYSYEFRTMRLNELRSEPTPEDSIRPGVLIQIPTQRGTD